MHTMIPTICKKLFIVSGLLCCVISCDRKSDIIIPSNRNSTTIPVDVALKSMDRILIETNNQTRATNPFFTISTFGKENVETKSANAAFIPDTLLYIVNFGNHEGFSVLAGDCRLPASIYCLTESGSISPDDFVDAFNYLSSPDIDTSYKFESVLVPSLILSSVFPALRENGEGGGEGDDDEDHDDWLQWLASEGEGGGQGNVFIKKGPFLKTKWDQDLEPLNNLVDGHVGCVAIAVGQIVVANKYSNTLLFDGVICNLDTLETVRHYSNPSSQSTPYSVNACYQASHFIKYLRSEDLLNMNGPESNAEAAKNAFSFLGYTNVEKTSNLLSFTHTMSGKVVNMLYNNYPVYVDGSRWGSGHAWVVDGFLYTQGILLFHINWGWNGIRDGYYDYGVFDTGRNHLLDSIIDTDDSSINVEDHHYFFDFSLIEYDL